MHRSRLELVGDLRELGVETGDVLMVHASLRAIGPVEGGAVGIISALEAAVGSMGTIVMNLGARDEFDWVNARPQVERPTLLLDAPAFDKDRTPADPDVGALAEVFRQLPGTLVNNHPDGRFGARGHLTRMLLQEPLPLNDYYGPGSPLDRLVQARPRSCDSARILTPSHSFISPNTSPRSPPSAESSVTTRSSSATAQPQSARSPVSTTPMGLWTGTARITSPSSLATTSGEVAQPWER